MTDRLEYDTDHDSAIPPTIQAHPDNVSMQIEMHFVKMEDVFAGYDTQVGRYHSANYKANQNYKEDPYPENPLYRLISTNRAQFLAGIPQCRLRTLSPDRAKELKASAIKHSANRLAREQRMDRLLEKLLVDWHFRRASVRYMSRPDPTADRGPLDGPAMRPIDWRVPPPDLIYDPCAREWEDTGLRGDRVIVSKRGVIRQGKANPNDGWLVDVLEGLVVGAGLDKMKLDRDIRSGNRDDLVIYRLWFPDEQIDEDMGPDEGFHGTERVYAEAETTKTNGRTHCGNLVEIKRPQPYFGPRTGPIGMFGQMYVPDQVEPLSVSTASEHVVKSHGIRSKTNEIAMSDYANLLICGGATGRGNNLARQIKNGQHRGVLSAPGYDGKNVKNFIKGGLDAAMMAAYEFESNRLDEILGLTSTQSGRTKPGVTATAEIQAAGGTGARQNGMLNSFVQIPREMFYHKCWQIDGNENFYMKLPPEVEMETGVPIAAIRGGRASGESFDDYEISIEVRSMKYRSEEELAMIAEKQLEIMASLGPLIPQTPWIDWESVLGDLGDALGLPRLAQSVNYPMAEQVAGMLLMTQLQPGSGFQGSEPRPGPFNAADKQGEMRTMDTTAQTKPFGAPMLAQGSAGKASPGKPAASGRSLGAKAGSRVKAGAR